jgi:hypothetical protein
LLGICIDAASAASVAAEGERALRAAGLGGKALVLEPDFVGLTLRD